MPARFRRSAWGRASSARRVAAVVVVLIGLGTGIVLMISGRNGGGAVLGLTSVVWLAIMMTAPMPPAD